MDPDTCCNVFCVAQPASYRLKAIESVRRFGMRVVTHIAGARVDIFDHYEITVS
jgi:hypothetical protein